MDWQIYLKIKYDGSTWTDVFTGISSGTMKLNRSIVQGGLAFGTIYASQFSCQLYATEIDLAGKEIQVVKRVGSTDKTLFTGKIDSSTSDYSGLYRDIVAYDAFYYLRTQNLADWWSSYWENRSSATVGQLRVAVAQEVGLTVVTRTLTNDSIEITKEVAGAYGQISFEDILHAVSEITATFPVIDGDGRLDWIYFRYMDVITTGKNLLTLPTTSTSSGVTFTVNENGTITVKGTATANVSFRVSASILLTANKSYYLSGCPSGGSTSTYRMAISKSGATTQYDTGSGAIFVNSGLGGCNVDIIIQRNFVCDNLVFSPMLMLLPNGTTDGEDISFEPPADGRVYLGKDNTEKASAEYEDFKTAAITEVQVLDTEKNMVAAYGDDDTNPFAIVGNFLLMGMSTSTLETICQAILTKIKTLRYYPFSLKMIYTNWDIELGMAVKTIKGNSYCTGYELSGSQLIDQSVEAVAASEYNEVMAHDYNMQMVTAKKYSNIEQTMDGITLVVGEEVNRATGEEERLAGLIEVNSGAITAEVTRATTAEGELSGRITVNSDAITSEVSRAEAAEGDLEDNMPIVNLLPNVYNREHKSGDTYVSNGITWKVNADGSVTANGTATAASSYSFTSSNLTGDEPFVPVMQIDPDKKYTLSGCTPTGSSNTYALRVRATAEGTTPSSSSGTIYSDYGTGVTIENKKYAYVYAIVQSGTSVQNLVFRPQFEVGDTAHAYQSTHGGSGALFTRVVQTEQDITTVISDVGDLQTMIREYSGGILVCKTGNTIGALVNANGSFDVVTVTWSGNPSVPTAGTVLWRGSSNGTYIYDSSGNVIGQFTGNGVTLGDTDTSYAFIDANGLKVHSIIDDQDWGDFGEIRIGTVKWNDTGDTDPGPYVTLGGRDRTNGIGLLSVAEGSGTEASGAGSHSEGSGSVASALATHAEGSSTASYQYAHAEGNFTTASGNSAHSEGQRTIAAGSFSHAGGLWTIANGDSQTAIGKYNVADSTSLLLIGNGTSQARSNAFKVDGTGNVTAAGGVTAGGAVSATGNISATGSVSGASMSATGNITATNITGSGTVKGATVTSTGNISGVNITGSGTVKGATVTSTGNITGVDITGSGTVKGATVTSTGAVNGSTASITNGLSAKSATITNAVSAGSVSSTGAISGASLSVTGDISAANHMTVNLLPSVYQYEQSADAIGNTIEINGVTWTINRDGSITANGTATANSAFNLTSYSLTDYNVSVIYLDPNKNYFLSGCPTGGAEEKYYLQIRATLAGTTPSASTGAVYKDYGSGVTFTGRKYGAVAAVVKSGVTVSNLTYFPMLEVGTSASPYQTTHLGTYALNKQLKDVKENLGVRVSQDQTTSVNVATATATNVNSLPIEIGHTYIVTAHIDYPTNAVGRRGLFVASTSGSTTPVNNAARVIQMAVDGAYTRMTCTFILRTLTTSTLYLTAYQTSGSTLAVTSYLDAVRLI